VPVNAALAYLLVLGVGPFPELGVPGAGWALLITTCAKLAILAVQAYAIQRVFTWHLPVGVGEWRSIAVPLVVLAMPLALTELLWSSGTFLYNVVAQRLGDGPLAAMQISATLESVFMVGSIGLMSATTALVGRSVGEHDPLAAAHWARRLTGAGVYTGLGFGLLLGASAFAVPILFANVGREVQVLAIIGIVINALTQVINAHLQAQGLVLLTSHQAVSLQGQGLSYRLQA